MDIQKIDLSKDQSDKIQKRISRKTPSEDLLEKDQKEKAISSSSGRGISLIDFFNSDDSSRDLDQEQALEAYYQSPPLSMAVSKIRESVGQVDYKWKDDAEPTQFNLDFPAPSQDLSKSDFFSLITAYLLLTGEIFILKKEGIDGINLIPLPSHLVEDLTENKNKYHVENIGLSSHNDSTVDRDELIIIKDNSLLDPFVEGRGLGQTIGSDVDIDRSAARHTASHLENNARPDMIALLKGAPDAERKRFEQSMRKKHGGPGSSGKIQGFTGGQDADITFKEIQSSFKDLGLNELRKWSEKVIRQIFGVPPSIIGDVTDTNRATAETEEYLYKKNTIKPIVQKIITAINNQFVKKDLNENFEIITENIVPEDQRFKLEVMKTFPEDFTSEEKRALAGHDPIEGVQNDS